MSARWTKDERFIICAYEEGLKKGDTHAVLNRYDIGKLSGLTSKGVNAVGTLLAQANFIKKVGDEEMYLTKNGEELALRLLSER